MYIHMYMTKNIQHPHQQTTTTTHSCGLCPFQAHEYPVLSEVYWRHVAITLRWCVTLGDGHVHGRTKSTRLQVFDGLQQKRGR